MAATLYNVKPRFQRMLEPIVDALERRGVSPDAVTWFGFAASVVSGALAVGAAQFRPAFLAVPGVLLVRMAANAVDGQLARRVGPTARGEVLNEVLDVAGDAAAYLPFALLVEGGAARMVGVVVVFGLVAEMAAVAGGGPRRNHGPLGKSDRALAFSLLAVLIGSGLASPQLVLGAFGVLVALALATIRNRMRAV